MSDFSNKLFLHNAIIWPMFLNVPVFQCWLAKSSFLSSDEVPCKCVRIYRKQNIWHMESRGREKEKDEKVTGQYSYQGHVLSKLFPPARPNCSFYFNILLIFICIGILECMSI